MFSRLAFIRILGLLLAPAPAVFLPAAPRAFAEQTVFDAGIKQSIISATGHGENSIEVATNAIQIMVTVVNSDLNNSLVTHADREADAVRIVDAIIAALKGKPAYDSLLAIHIDYVSRETNTAHSRVVDAIDYRRDAKGGFELHKT
ncbi:hypothetical protein [Mesorhizobium sp. J8]|uniref:hypothetical protein n=1 Tax=Mesorhizobium sp. J8 TaxID=2777475 RepID=UPI0019165C9E|nr:hypothetical protein [Mesorhizobium sp. J8]BCM20884.1 hypothetical protein MJ8_46750 [Mesorhizobium sp. J8]